ncbi:MAG: hypothetical protein K0R50_1752 [Eubacterium sp.]|jgi:hypothetical protein|nr:hypothetical protein [Eubacterium sp.]
MILLFIIYAFIAWIKIPELIRKKEWRELSAFSVFYIIGFVLGLLYVLDIPVPNPMKGLQYIISEVWGLKYPQ